MSRFVPIKRVHVVALVLLAAAGFTLAHRLDAPTAFDDASQGAIAASSATPSGAGGVHGATPGRTLSTERPQRLVVSLRLDPSLTQSIFMGDRWVAPAEFYFAQPGSEFVVQAKAQHRDGRGELHDFAGNWNATNPTMVAIQRNARDVTLQIRQPGDSDVTVAAGGETVVLHVHAVQLADSMQVHIRQ